LSGGERNRLLLARLFTRPANVLVLDEPTNDLDLETLELLEEELVDWPGTLLLVSHDRAFLDNVVTSTFVFESDGRVQEYVGGYEDWVRQRSRQVRLEPDTTRDIAGQAPAAAHTTKTDATRAGSRGTPPGRAKVSAGRQKLSFKEQRELEQLPARIEALEAEERTLNARIAGPDFYKEGAEAIRETLARTETIVRELSDAYARWGALESRMAAQPERR
jgi:ABC transport system ATP-binding/permease protein